MGKQLCSQPGFDYAERIFRILGMRAWDRLAADGYRFRWDGFNWRFPSLPFTFDNNHVFVWLQDHGEKRSLITACNVERLCHVIVQDSQLKRVFAEIEQMGVDI